MDTRLTYKSAKRKTYLLLDPNDGGTFWDKVVNAIIVSLIVANTLAVILETVDSFYAKYQMAFEYFELFSVVIFTIEYILRVWSITESENYQSAITGRLRFMSSPGAIVDLLAIIPFYFPLKTLFDLRFLRLFRLIRFFRFFKLARYLNASKIIRRVFTSKKEELVLSFVITLFLIVISASVMYFIEHDAQPDKFSSIPETMWWSVATLTTVGYGDVYPITITGKILASFISILGIGMFALPAGILASGFSEEFKNTRQKRMCPHCGEVLE
jgi:voltage-gated potassium channel